MSKVHFTRAEADAIEQATGTPMPRCRGFGVRLIMGNAVETVGPNKIEGRVRSVTQGDVYIIPYGQTEAVRVPVQDVRAKIEGYRFPVD